MFEYMLESSPAKRKARNPWAYTFSVLLQITVLFVLILIPLLNPEALPKTEMLSWLAAPPPPPPPPPPPAAAAPVKRIKQVSLMEAGKLRAPTAIPKEIVEIKEELGDTGGGVVGGVPGGVPGGQMGGVLGGVLGGIPSAVPPPPKPEAPKRIRVSSGVQEARRITYVEPVYPPLARQARISGTVQLEAIIARDGSIQNLRVIEGHPLLVQAAVQAVQQWRYQATLLNNEPVEVVTVINVVFKLY